VTLHTRTLLSSQPAAAAAAARDQVVVDGLLQNCDIVTTQHARKLLLAADLAMHLPMQLNAPQHLGMAFAG
jgi:hypothetical protein